MRWPIAFISWSTLQPLASKSLRNAFRSASVEPSLWIDTMVPSAPGSRDVMAPTIVAPSGMGTSSGKFSGSSALLPKRPSNWPSRAVT